MNVINKQMENEMATFTADGFNSFKTFDSLEDAAQAAKSAPWANGGVYAGEHMSDSTQIIWLIEPYIFNDECN